MSLVYFVTTNEKILKVMLHCFIESLYRSVNKNNWLSILMAMGSKVADVYLRDNGV